MLLKRFRKLLRRPENPPPETKEDENQHNADFVEALCKTEHYLHNAEDPQEIALYAMKMACEFFDAEWCGLLNVDLEVGIWTPEIWYDRKKGPMEKTLFNEFEYSQHFLTWVKSLETGEPVIVPDTESIRETNPEEYQAYQRLQTHSVIGVPFGKHPNGFLVVKNMKRYKTRFELLQMLCFVAMMMLDDKEKMDAAKVLVRPVEIKDDHDVQIRLFGTVEIITSKGAVDEDTIALSRAWKLLVYLLDKEGKARTRTIVRDLWPDENEDKAMGNLRTTLYRFRQKTTGLLPEHLIVSDANYYYLNPKLHILTDFQRVEECLKEAKDMPESEEKLETMKTAFRLFKGRVFESSCAEPWMIEMDQKAQILYANVVYEVLHLLNAAGDYTRICEYATIAIKIMPAMPTPYYWLIHTMHNRGADTQRELELAERNLTDEDYKGLLKLLKFRGENAAQEIKIP